ncbi:hypothetical protein [Flammeovirga sp. SubArs3]|uniref:hypothetical protein n=1 Tax=Flammeovirga sp. SubArs3 TaxID=2995316 RepID=UPI00248B521C|nr:hypothetical protein [Flammeovirga sp. SubArs3]
MKTISIYLLLLFSSISLTFAQGNENEPEFDRGIIDRVFIPKGQWLVGATFNYSEHSNDNYQILMLKNWEGKGHNFKVSPFFGYFLKDNLAVGGRFTFVKSELNIDALELDLGEDINISIDGVSNISQTYYTSIFMRNYISLGKGNRFGLFNETSISYGYGQSKNTNIKSGPHDVSGVYSTSHELNIGMSPGMVAFINNNIALEVKMDIIGFNMKTTEQIENQVETGSRRTSSASFDIDIFSLNIGLTLFI